MAKTSIENLSPEQVAAATIKCAVCGHEDLSLIDHISETHGVTVEQYQADHAGHPVVSNLLLEIEAATQPKVTRRAGHEADTLSVDMGGFQVPYNHKIPGDACLKLPANFAVPRHGQLGKDVEEAVLYLLTGRSLWISGPPGTGKDALVHAYSALCRKPALRIGIVPGEHVGDLLYTQTLAGDGVGGTETSVEYHDLWRALTEGYTCPQTGETTPMLILFSDIDRGTQTQIELLCRSVLDSIEGAIMGPNGPVAVVPGTQFVATANSQGQGDETGRCISANAIDSSIMDRFETACLFSPMSSKDEGPIIASKFQPLFAAMPEALNTLMACTKALRMAVANGTLYAEFTHRTLCAWAQTAQDRLRLKPKTKTKNLLGESANCWIKKLGDQMTRAEAARIIDPYLKGGFIAASDLEGDDELVEGF